MGVQNYLWRFTAIQAVWLWSRSNFSVDWWGLWTSMLESGKEINTWAILSFQKTSGKIPVLLPMVHCSFSCILCFLYPLWVDNWRVAAPDTELKVSCAEQCAHVQEELRSSRERHTYNELSVLKVKYGKHNFILLTYWQFSCYICSWFCFCQDFKRKTCLHC